MQWRNTSARWGLVAQALHWLIALAVFTLFTLGWIMVNLRISPTKFELYAIHKSLGVTVFALVLLRLAWRLTQPRPAHPPGTPAWEQRVATLTHAVLYGLLLAMPISGYLINSAANFPLTVWGVLPLPNFTGENERLQELAEAAHLTFFCALAGLVALHVAAALRHHWLLKDNVLKAMLPWGGRGEKS